MSFRELRNFTELARSLGFPRLISMENFRVPNFPLIAEILSWLVQHFDPNTNIPADVETEQDRVLFIRSVTQFMIAKAHVQMNTKKLYQADGYAVKELLKAALVLDDAMKAITNTIVMESEEDHGAPLNTADIANNIAEIKQLRNLSSQITSKGASIYGLLQKESQLKEKRGTVLSKELDLTEVEEALIKATAAVNSEIIKTNELMENVAANEANLDAKIGKKKVELDRSKKRLQTLRKVRPSFMDEFERLEEELKEVYTQYIEKYRCLSYLQKLQEDYERSERDQMEERQAATKKLLERMNNEDLSLQTLEGSSELLMDGESDSDDGVNVKEARKTRKGKATGLPSNAPIRRVFGNMSGNAGYDSGSPGSDSDLILDGEGDDDGSDLGSSESDELEIERRKTAATARVPRDIPSDDDF